MDLTLAHVDAGRIEAELRARGVDVAGTEYAEVATLHLTTADPVALDAHIAALTGGTAVGIRKGPRWRHTDS